MHKEFADWYRQASVAPASELLDARWSGIEKLSDEPSRSQLINLLVLFCRDPSDAFVAPDYMDEAFREFDSTFPRKGNVHELRILAGAALRTIIDNDGDSSIAAAYGLVCGSFGVSAESIPTTEHVAHAQSFLANRAISVREPAPVSLKNEDWLTKDELEAALPATAFAAIGTLRDPLIATLSDIVKKGRLAAKKVADTQSQLIEAQREELDLLWWLQNSYSHELERSISEMSVAESCLVIAFDLARVTRFIPGPTSIVGMITTALSRADATTPICLQDAVNALPRHWRESHASNLEKGSENQICPVQSAIAASLETDGDDEWVPVFAKRSRLSAKTVHKVPQLAYQAYLERMFIRALEEFN